MALTIIERNVQLDLYDHDLTPSKIKAIALDSKTRYVGAEIHNGGQTYDVGQNTGVTLTIIRPDKTGVQITGETFTYAVGEGETVYGAYAELTQTALAISGTLKAQFMLTSGDQILRTETFDINNGVALDAEVSEWAGEYQGYNLDELVQSVNESSAKVDAMEADVSELKSGFNELATISNGNLIDFGEHQLDIDGVTISIAKDKLTINGVIGSSAIRLKLTGTVEYNRTSSNPSVWNNETVDWFENGKSYNAYTEKLTGTITGTGDVFTFRDGTGTTVLSASKGTVVITDRVAYGMFYFKYGQAFDNVTYQIVLTQSSERIPISDLAEKKLKPDIVVPYADDAVKSVMGSMPKEYTSTAFFTETAYASTHEMQGVASDGTHLYYCMHGATDADNSVVGKINISSGTLVAEVADHCYKHANDICYYPTGDELRIAPLANSGTIFCVEPSTLAYKTEYDMTQVIADKWLELTLSIAGIAYDSTHDMFVYLLSRTSGLYHGLAICTSDNQLVKIIKCITDYTALRGGITCDDRYIYLCLGDVDGSRTKAILRAYDWNGNVINDATFVSPHTFECVSLGTRIFASFANDTITELTVAENRTISLLDVLGHFNPN